MLLSNCVLGERNRRMICRGNQSNTLCVASMTAGNVRRRDRSTLKIQFAAQILVNEYPSKNTGGSAGSKSGTTLLREEQIDLICQGTKSAPRPVALKDAPHALAHPTIDNCAGRKHL
jgi:hypothetical protein